MTTLDKIKAEIQKVLDAEGDSESAKAQALALFWVLELIDKYAEQEPSEDAVSRADAIDQLRQSPITYIYITGLETYSNDNKDGMYIKWQTNIGYGEYRLAFVDGRWEADSECMDCDEDKSFLKMLFDEILEQVEIVG